jgi:hypothetical protein
MSTFISTGSSPYTTLTAITRTGRPSRDLGSARRYDGFAHSLARRPLPGDSCPLGSAKRSRARPILGDPARAALHRAGGPGLAPGLGGRARSTT